MFLQHWLTEPCKTQCFCNVGLQNRVKHSVFATFAPLIPSQSRPRPPPRGAPAEDAPQGRPQDAPRMPQLRGVAPQRRPQRRPPAQPPSTHVRGRRRHNAGPPGWEFVAVGSRTCLDILAKLHLRPRWSQDILSPSRSGPRWCTISVRHFFDIFRTF